MREKRELTNAQARELVFERMLDGQEYECVKEITEDNGRWDLWIQNTFKNVETEEYWRINWTRGKTEQQDYHSLQGDGTHDLHPVEKRMVVTEKFVGANYKPSGHHVILEFDEAQTAEEFTSWYSGSGEQDFGTWLDCQPYDIRIKVDETYYESGNAELKFTTELG